MAQQDIWKKQIIPVLGNYLTIFTCVMSRLQELCQSVQLLNINLEGLQPQLGEIRQIHLHDQRLPAELKKLVKTDNVEKNTFRSSHYQCSCSFFCKIFLIVLIVILINSQI